MNLNQIISEADMLVPNEVDLADKVLWLNALNQDFFNVVKIPKIAHFDCVAGQTDYVLPSEISQKNIDKLLVGPSQYRSLDREDVTPYQNAFAYDDSTRTLSLFPAPYDAFKGFLRYHRVATSNFVSTTLTVPPDAPEEYHWTFIPALAAMLANSQDDSVKASNYENQYKAAWNVASQNYQAGAVQ
ncbi:hypothetical protein BK124_11605 [Paenibacillus amylolyticus]|uniref:phage adaptor protein n=1 Tax=Paenibacillus amylolyticus TaxID=1451 RepID=UPI00096F9509|nr:hypothetical protein [Paenibacillus amylolyticus]OMF00294.1 hypothetical protein BK124_11605 [Paenibacillus amylolyticus]